MCVGQIDIAVPFTSFRVRGLQKHIRSDTGFYSSFSQFIQSWQKWH